MTEQINRNKGFTLVELLICMALLSIIMLMVVQFMSTTTAANRKTKNNLRAQNEAKEVMLNIADTLVQADYVQVRPQNSYVYKMSKDSGSRTKALAKETGTIAVMPTGNMSIVPDNYGNYVRPSTVAAERKVIIDMDTYQLPGEKKDTVYPLTGDLDTATMDARSFRILKQKVEEADGSSHESYLYIEPLYIYAEYNVTDDTGAAKVKSVVYYFTYKSGKLDNIYLYRSGELEPDTPSRWYSAITKVPKSGDQGLLTDNVSDFYISADAEGEVFLVDSLFDVDGYLYNAAETINFRNSSVLTVRPQNLYKKASTGSGGSGGTGGGSGGTGGSTDDGSGGSGGSGTSGEDAGSATS